MHQRELTEVEINAKSQEVVIKEEHGRKVKAAHDELRDILREEHRLSLSRISSNLRHDIEELDRVQSKLVAQLESDHERELELTKSSIEQRREKERRRGRESVNESQHAIQSRLQELREQHARELKKLRVAHDVPRRNQRDQIYLTKPVRIKRLHQISVILHSSCLVDLRI